MRRSILLLTTALAAASGPAGAQELGLTLDRILFGTAFRDDRALLDTPVTTTSREGAALANRQAGTVGELIGDIAGVSIDGGPRGIAQEPNIRGFRDEQIVLRFDGGRFNFSQGHRGRFFVDPALLQRVEVVRGGGSTLYGSGALGGVISFETVDVADLIQPGQTMGGRVGLGYSSNGERLTANTTLFADYGNLDALLFLGTRQTGSDLETGGGVIVPFSDIDSMNGMIKLGFEPSEDNRIEFSFSQFQDTGLTAANANGLANAGNPVVDRDADVQDLRLSWDFTPEGSDLVDLSMLFYATRLEIAENRVTPPTPARLDETRYDTVGLEVTNRSRLSFGLPLDLVYGFEMLRDTQEGLRNGAPRPAFPNAEATSLSAFAEATAELNPQWALVAGLRFDLYERDPNDPTLAAVSNEFLSPRIGVNFRPSAEWQVYANLSQAFRAPSLTELYNSGVHFPLGPFANNVFVPNPNLLPEESLQAEIGVRLDRGGVFGADDRLSFSANIYHADVTNYIEQIVAATTTSTRNVDARLWGFEAEADYDAGLWFARAGLGIARGQGTGGAWLGSIPQDRLTLSAGYRPSADWEIGARATIAAEQARVPATVAVAPGYELLDAYATWAPDSGPLAGSEIRFGVDNIFDKTYRIYPNGLSQPGRSVKITASFRF